MGKFVSIILFVITVKMISNIFTMTNNVVILEAISENQTFERFIDERRIVMTSIISTSSVVSFLANNWARKKGSRHTFINEYYSKLHSP